MANTRYEYQASPLEKFLSQFAQLYSTYQLKAQQFDIANRAANSTAYTNAVRQLTSGISSSSPTSEIKKVIESFDDLNTKVEGTNIDSDSFFSTKFAVGDSLNRQLDTAENRDSIFSTMIDNTNSLKDINLEDQTMTEFGAPAILDNMENTLKSNIDNLTSVEFARLSSSLTNIEKNVNLGLSMEYFDTDLKKEGLQLGTGEGFDFLRKELTGVKARLMLAIHNLKNNDFENADKQFQSAVSGYMSYKDLSFDAFKKGNLMQLSGSQQKGLSQDYKSLIDMKDIIMFHNEPSKNAKQRREFAEDYFPPAANLFELGADAKTLSPTMITKYKPLFEEALENIISKGGTKGWLSNELEKLYTGEKGGLEGVLSSDMWKNGLYGTRAQKDSFKDNFKFDEGGFQTLRWIDQVYSHLLGAPRVGSGNFVPGGIGNIDDDTGGDITVDTTATDTGDITGPINMRSLFGELSPTMASLPRNDIPQESVVFPFQPGIFEGPIPGKEPVSEPVSEPYVDPWPDDDPWPDLTAESGLGYAESPVSEEVPAEAVLDSLSTLPVEEAALPVEEPVDEDSLYDKLDHSMANAVVEALNKKAKVFIFDKNKELGPDNVVGVSRLSDDEIRDYHTFIKPDGSEYKVSPRHLKGFSSERGNLEYGKPDMLDKERWVPNTVSFAKREGYRRKLTAKQIFDSYNADKGETSEALLYDYVTPEALKKMWDDLPEKEKDFWNNDFDNFRTAKETAFANQAGYGNINLDDYEKLEPVEEETLEESVLDKYEIKGSTIYIKGTKKKVTRKDLTDAEYDILLKEQTRKLMAGLKWLFTPHKPYTHERSLGSDIMESLRKIQKQ